MNILLVQYASEPVRQAQDEQPTSSLQRFWSELKRRKVTRVAVTYAVVA